MKWNKVREEENGHQGRKEKEMKKIPKKKRKEEIRD